MKNYLIICSIIIIILTITMKKYETTDIIIPQEAIRFRVIANSNSSEDQNIKLNVKNNLTKTIDELIADSNNIDDTRKLLIQNKNVIENSVKNTLISNNFNQNFNVNYGMNYFPEKQFKGITYKAGEYESLVVTLGQGKGNNWWCVLFPPLCLLEAEENNTDEVEYQFLVKNIIDKFMEK